MRLLMMAALVVVMDFHPSAASAQVLRQAVDTALVPAGARYVAFRGSKDSYWMGCDLGRLMVTALRDNPSKRETYVFFQTAAEGQAAGYQPSLLDTIDCSPPSQVKVSDTEFEPAIRFVGHPHRINSLGVNATQAGAVQALRSWVDKRTWSATHQLYVEHEYVGDWIFWENANGSDSRRLGFEVISRDVENCQPPVKCHLIETVGIALPDSLLRAHLSNGYRVKMYAKTGREVIITITPQQLAAQLDAIEDYKRQRGM